MQPEITPDGFGEAYGMLETKLGSASARLARCMLYFLSGTTYSVLKKTSGDQTSGDHSIRGFALHSADLGGTQLQFLAYNMVPELGKSNF